MFYRRKYYLVKNEFVDAFNQHFNDTNLPNQLKNGSRLVGRWMRKQDENLTEIFAIWEYDHYDQYVEIETRIKQNEAHVQRIRDWYEKHGGRDYIYKELIVEVKNEALESTVSL
ncbi:NIPSNAP family protein [Jeotgalibacillus aurantiacus]|uniref:NIPSNAP family protein n=1 Tax=Jeotgalibacillus aurantiacus TaxID=2763266 RepID=UPI001D09D563|nr:NIPSNAP family protein [Jeotgalibacillus aurantiacus]